MGNWLFRHRVAAQDGRWLNFMAPEDVITRVNAVSDLTMVHLEATILPLLRGFRD